MIFRYELVILRPLPDVIRLFRNRQLQSKWQRGLVSNESLPTKDGKPQYLLMYNLGRRKLKMTETILKDDLPTHYRVHVQVKGAQHIASNSFSVLQDNSTKWISEVEFDFSGLMNLLARFMKKNFEEQTLMYMKSFKSFAEKYEGYKNGLI